MDNKITSIRNGEYELLDSGIIQILTTNKTTLLFNNVSIIFEFETDTENEDSTIKMRGVENSIEFMLKNINRPSYGTTDFLKIGKFNEGQDLYISFRINSLDDKKVRSLEYSIYKK